GGGAAHPPPGRDRAARRRGLSRHGRGAQGRRHRDDAAPATGAHARLVRAVDARVFPLLRARLRQAQDGQARRADHASRPDEPRRRDRQRDRRRHRPQPDPPAGRDGCRGADGLPRNPRPGSRPGQRAGDKMTGGQMTGRKQLFRNARLIDPASGRDAPGDVLVAGDCIAAIGPGLSAEGGQIVECAGLCLAPGLVDMRVQLREPGAEHMESIESGGLAAAAGGVTTMVALPNTEPPVDDVSVVEFIARRAREARLAKIHTYAAATKGLAGKELTEIGLLAANGAVAFTDGVKAISNALVMRRVLAYARSFDQLVIQHPEEPHLGGAGEVTEGETATRLGLAGVTPMAEVIMLERDLRLVEITGARYHAAHVSTEEGIAAIRKAKAAGLPVTCDTAPPYFVLNETAIGDYRTFAKLSPPLRAERDRQAVADGIADGTIDAIASDHSPWDQDSKRLPFSSASYGIVGLET